MLRRKEVSAKLRILKQKHSAWKKFYGVHYIDVGYKYRAGQITDEICFRFHVYQKLPDNFLQSHAIPAMLEGVPTDILAYIPSLSNRSGQYAQNLLGGIEIQNCFLPNSGTLGCIFNDTSNRLVGLTNYHVLFGKYGQVGQPVTQPFRILGNESEVIGKIHTPGLKRLDAAVFELNLTRPGLAYQVLELAGRLRYTRIADLDLPVVKSGVATGVTYGLTDGVGVDLSFSVRINTLRPPNNDVLTASGDSGSIWLLDNGQHNTAVGLNFLSEAAQTRARAYDIRSVMKSMNLTFINN